MKRWPIVFLLLFAAPLAAQQESNFGRVILAKCDLIALGVASAHRTRVKDLIRVEVSIEKAIYGKTDLNDVQLFLNDPDALKKDEAVRGLFALKALSSGGFQLVGKPVPTPTGDAEENDKIAVAKAYINLEAQKAGDERTASFWALLETHVRQGGYAAQNAGVELMFVARDRAGIITEELFTAMRAAVDESTKVLTQQASKDLKLALQGMVEARIKSLKFRKVRRAEKAADRVKAVEELKTLHGAYQRAFTDADAKLCDALYDAEKDASVRDKLDALAVAIRDAERQRQADAERKARESAPPRVPPGE